jgi:hypothetical protein
MIPCSIPPCAGFWRKLPVPGGARSLWHQKCLAGETTFWGSVSVGIDRLAAYKTPMLSASTTATSGRWRN